LKFLGVFYRSPAGRKPPEDTEYEFILGSEEGSGAFLFPCLSGYRPYRTFAETEDRMEIRIKDENAAALRKALGEGSPIPACCLQPGPEDSLAWSELNRAVRPYDNFTRNGDNAFQKPDIFSLKELANHFRGPLASPELPLAFRECSDYIAGADAELLYREMYPPPAYVNAWLFGCFKTKKPEASRKA
jgi:hypothetical protein